ncbi:MAG: TolC family outer membrane protein [Pseudomonadota bacterium]
MRLSLHPLASAILLAATAGSVSAADLMDAYEMARQSDPVLSAAESRSFAQDEGVVQSRAALLPQLSGDVTYSRTETDFSGSQAFGTVVQPPSESSSENTNSGWGISLRQSIFDFGNYTRLGAARARAGQVEAEYEAAQDALVVRVADAYFNVLTAIETLASSRAEERSVKRQLDQAEKRLEVGLAPITDVHEARARFDTARANAIAAANALDDAREALAEITGTQVNNLQGLAPDYVPEVPEGLLEQDWVAIAMEYNPTLLARELAVAAAEKDIGTARSGHLPSLALTAGYSDGDGDGSNDIFSPTPGSNSFDNSAQTTRVGLTLSVPLFAGGATQSGVRQAVHFRDIATDQLEQERRAVVRQTRNAERSLGAGAAEVEARRLSVVSARAAYEASEAGLEVGTRTIVDVLITQQSLFQAQREYARARHAFLVNVLRLKQAGGTIDISDLQEVNRVLVADADAALETTVTD